MKNNLLRFTVLTLLVSIVLSFQTKESYAYGKNYFAWGTRTWLTNMDAQNEVNKLNDYADGITRLIPFSGLLPHTGAKIVVSVVGVNVTLNMRKLAREIDKKNKGKGVYIDINGWTGGWSVNTRK